MIVSKHNSDLNELFSLKKSDLISIVSKINIEEAAKRHISLWKVSEDGFHVSISHLNIYKKIKIKDFKLENNTSYIFLVVEK